MTELGFREPPEGAIVGESVPTENDQEQLDQGLVDEMVSLMKQHPVYGGRADDELRELAKEKLH